MPSRLLYRSLIVAAVVLACGEPIAAAGASPTQEHVGRLIGTSAEGQGWRRSEDKKGPAVRGRVAWVYCFESGGESFTAASKKSPKGLGLAAGDEVRFSVRKQSLRLRDKEGTLHELLLRSRSSEKRCR